jgi:hypothetical protein
MPMQKGQSNLNASLAAHADDPTEQRQDYTRLPGGITGGVAQLVSAKLGTYKDGANKGERYVRMAATVFEPARAVDTQRVWEDGDVRVVSSREVAIKGLQTSVMYPMCATKSARTGEITPADKNIQRMLNDLRTIGGDEITHGIKSEADLQTRLEALERAGPFIRFGTRAGDPSEQYPTPRVFESWYGAAADYNPDNPTGPMDYTGNGREMVSGAAIADAEQHSDILVNLEALGTRADNQDRAAQDELKSMALSAGYTEDDISDAKDWSEIATMLQGTNEGGTEEQLEQEVPWKPEKGAVANYHVLNPKTNRKIKVEAEILATDGRSKTATIRRLDTRATIKGIRWDALSEIS